MSNQLAGKTAIVTGASKGIGAEIARHLAREGASVVVNYASSKQDAENVANEIHKLGAKAIAIQADISKEADVVRLFNETTTAFEHVDILVNNAGVYAMGPIEEFTQDQYQQMYDLNVLGLLLATREAVKHVGPDGGSIINIGSIVSTAAMPYTSAYSGTKGAVDAITLALAAELGPRHIRVNAINPGLVNTEGTRTLGLVESEGTKQLTSQTPLGRMGQPDDIAPVAAFLASDNARWVTGQLIKVSGGLR